VATIRCLAPNDLASLGLTVRAVAAEMTYPLRQRVLRPHQRLDEMAWDGDDDADAGHFVAVDPEGEIAGAATIVRRAPDWLAGEALGWRLRGMATRPEWRGMGVGTALLSAAVDHALRHGGGIVWCHARVRAADFYERAGFSRRGTAWEEPVIGPHVLMFCAVDPHESGHPSAPTIHQRPDDWGGAST
jgi:GNAT superfamily N-acetyltransferase